MPKLLVKPVTFLVTLPLANVADAHVGEHHGTTVQLVTHFLSQHLPIFLPGILFIAVMGVFALILKRK